MPIGLGPRFLIEAGFIIAVAVIAGLERFSTLTIVLAMLLAWLVVAVVEAGIWFAARRKRDRRTAAPWVAMAETAGPREREPSPEYGRVVAVAPLPEAEAPEEIQPGPEHGALASLRPRAPREWNLWDLDRLAREQSGTDSIRDEERSYLLMYLREFASPDGVLPADFDGVIRESFGDVIDAVHS